MRIRRFWQGALVVAVAVAVGGCGGAAEPGTTGPAFDGELVVGADLELTGPGAVVGAAHRNALVIAVDQINERGVTVGGHVRKLRLIVRDNASDPAKGEEIARSLIGTDHVVAIVGAGTSPVSMAMVPTVEKLGVPMVTLAASDAIVNPVAERRYIFKVTPNGADIAAAIVDNARRLGVRKFGMLTVRSTYGDLVTQAMTPAIAGRGTAGLTLAHAERFAEDGSDLPERVADLLAAKPDGILIGSLMPSAGLAAAALTAAGYAGKVFLDPAAGADALLIGPNRTDAEGMYMVHPAVLDPDAVISKPSGLAQKEFRKRYIRAHGSFSGPAPNAYDAVQLVVEAVTRANSEDRAKVRDALETMNYDGISGSYAFNTAYHGGMNADTLTLFTVHHGGWQRVY